jgi:hypothetical protein
MAVSAEASSLQRLQCRQIVESDLDALARLFMAGIPNHARDFWDTGLARVAALAPVEGMPRIGYALESEQGIVGALLTLSSRRGPQIICNVSAWCVEPRYRAHSTLLTTMATKHKDVIYLNISPADHTLRIMEQLGWKPYNFGRSAAFPVLGLGGGTVRETIPADLPERKLLEDHRALDCISLVCEKHGIASPFVFKPRQTHGRKLPMMDLIYCRSTADFERCGAALGRHFLARGYFGFILDGKVKYTLSHYIAGKQPRLYKGPLPPDLNDFAYTEKVLFA